MASYRRLFRLRFTRTRHEEIDDEFAFHLDMRARELEAGGLPRDVARQEAQRQFGNIHDARAFCRAEDEKRMRDYRWALLVDNARQDIRVALRAMRRQPAFTIASVLTLGVAIGIAAAAYGVLHAYLIRPLPYPEPDRLVHVIAGPSRQFFPNAPNLDAVDWAAADSAFAETVRWDLDGFTLAGGERPEYVEGAWVSAGYFRALGMHPAIGRGFGPDEYRRISPVAIISDALWSRRYGRDPSIVGRAIRAHSTDRPNEDEVVTVVGVMPPDVWHVTRFTDVLRPLTTPRMISMARLKPGQTIHEAQSRLNAIVIPQLSSVDPAWRMTLVGVQEEYTFQVQPTLVALAGATVFLVLIGGASVAAAQTARAATRRTELQLREALGASRLRIMVQLVLESLTTAIAAAIVGATLAAVLLSALSTTIDHQLVAGVPGGAHALPFSLGMLAAVVGAGAAAGAVFGLIPAFAMSQGSGAIGALGAQRGGSASGTAPKLRRGLIVVQLAFTMMLLVGAGLMGRSILAIFTTPMGFEPDQVVKGNLLFPRNRYPNEAARWLGMERLLGDLRRHPGVRGAAAASPHPFRNAGQPGRVTAEGRMADASVGSRARPYVVTDGYFEVMGIPLRTGRGFTHQDDAASIRSVVISEGLARELWPDQVGVGRRLRVGEDTVWRTVVGIAGDIREPVDAAQAAEVYLPYAQSPRPYVSVLVRVVDDPAQAGPAIRQAVAATDDLFALADVEPMSEVISRDSRRHRTLATVLSGLGLLALGIAMLGLYGALAYVVAQRRREIAVRIAVGADAGRIRGMVIREGALVVAWGIAAGSALSLVLTRVLATQLYGVTPTDPGTFASIAVLLAIAALAAAASPIRRALSVPPAEVLRAE